MTSPVIKVSSISFCKNFDLRQRLLKSFPNTVFTNSKENLSEKQLIDFYKDADAILVGTEKITHLVAENSQHIQVLSKYGVGIDNIDFEALKNYKIKVLLSSGTNKVSVAELTLSFILGLLHNVFQKGFLLKKSIWQKNGGHQLYQKKVGIIGYGNVGQTLHQFLKPFDCQIYVNDIKSLDQLSLKNNFIIATKKEVFKTCDIVTLHVPLDQSTKKIINKENLKLMKPSAFLVNTARGNLININDLHYALSNNIIAGAALDVFPQEPPQNSKFLALENLMVTPHIGGNAKEAQWNMGIAAIEKLEQHFSL
ncbi:MAG: hydroxyacid dehydrogenase [Candidatus Cloacimonadota bacterium]|nr:MAG: hydroxyacid dehydrogenase [Candidatus Cloacimonadota bacterium]